MGERVRRRGDASVDVWSGDNTSMADSDIPNNYGGSSLHGDRGNLAILFFLYLLQGLPMGLSAAIPMIMQNRGASYKQQAEFSLVAWPFSLKLLWAPIVDTFYSKSFGRRKSWLVPAQYVIGLFMLFLGANVDNWLGEDVDSSDPAKALKQPNAGMLTMMFVLLNFLAATQDIAVDGWALTMLNSLPTPLRSRGRVLMWRTFPYFLSISAFTLRLISIFAVLKCDYVLLPLTRLGLKLFLKIKRNIGHASTCNSVGQTAGYFLGYVVFMALHSADICNTYLRSEPSPHGMVTISSFLHWWGWVFLVTTTLVAIFKKEEADHDTHESQEGIKKAYGLLWKIACLPSVFTLSIVLLTAKIGFSASDSVSSLKLVDAGVPKETLAFLAVLLVPLQIVLPLAISKYTTGERPMDVYLKAVPYRLFLNLVIAALVYLTPMFVSGGKVPVFYYGFVLVVYCVHQIAQNSMFVAVMAFFARVSDPSAGGTYMTLLNTVANMGTTWPATLSLWMVDSLTSRQCIGESPVLEDNFCSGENEKEACIAAGGSCDVQVDGYYVEVAICTVLGCLWLFFARTKILSLQGRNFSSWKVPSQRTR